jgi:hypothetical protein
VTKGLWLVTSLQLLKKIYDYEIDCCSEDCCTCEEMPTEAAKENIRMRPAWGLYRSSFDAWIST